MSTKEKITLADPDIQRCPFETYHYLHEHAPVFHDPATGFFEITRYQDLVDSARNFKTFSSRRAIDPADQTPAQAEIARIYEAEGYPPMEQMINADPPVQRKYRSLVDDAFRPQRVNAMVPQIEGLVDELIDDFSDAGDAEFMAEFAILLPVYVIADMIGIARARRDDFKRWSDALIAINEPTATDEQRLALVRPIIEMHQFFAAEFEAARENPQQNILGDLATGTVDGRPVTTGEAVNMMSNLLVAGNETTTAGLGNGLIRLMEDPALQARLRRQPEQVPDFVEEALRLDAPLQCFFRRAVKDVEVAGATIPEDSVVVLRYGAGNRDAEHFENPDAVDLDRPDIRRHLAFGFGIHTCVGNLLARTEMAIAFTRLLARLNDMRLDGEAVYQPSFLTYGPRSLPIRFSKA